MLYEYLNEVNKQEFIESLHFKGESTILGIDLGQKKVGLAICNLKHPIPTPLKIFARTEAILKLKTCIIENKISGIVVGISIIDEKDRENKVKAINQFLKASQVTSIPVYFVSEENTSKEADILLKELNLKRKQRNQRDDKIAAMLILERFLNIDN